MYIPKILYASRTHTQLSQTVKELKATVYNPTVSVLASREQLCIDKHVMEVESNAAKTAVCRQKVKQRMCGHYIGFEQSTVVSAFPRRTSPSFLLHRSLWCRSHPSPLPLPSRSFVFQYLLSFFRIKLTLHRFFWGLYTTSFFFQFFHMHRHAFVHAPLSPCGSFQPTRSAVPCRPVGSQVVGTQSIIPPASSYLGGPDTGRRVLCPSLLCNLNVSSFLNLSNRR